MFGFKTLTYAALAVFAATPALSNIYVTAPVATTTAHGGRNLRVEWKDDGVMPSVSNWGSLNIYLATGSHDVQYKLQTLDTDLPTSITSRKYIIDPSVGPDGGYYFIRFEGTRQDASGHGPLAFSSRFTIDNMTGKFNSTIMDQLNGAGGIGSVGGSAVPTHSSSSTSKGAMQTLSVTRISTTSAATPTNSANTQKSSANSLSNHSGFASVALGLVAFSLSALL